MTFARLLSTAILAALVALPVAAEDTPAASSAQPPAGVEAHLASYRTRATAEKGWHILADQYSSVLYFQPSIREVDLPGKGHFFRLYADGDAALLSSLCTSMAERRLYCVLHTGQHP